MQKNNSNCLRLVLTFHWWNMITEKGKREEYRKCGYWLSRRLAKFEQNESEYHFIIFQKGYTAETAVAKCTAIYKKNEEGKFYRNKTFKGWDNSKGLKLYEEWGYTSEADTVFQLGNLVFMF